MNTLQQDLKDWAKSLSVYFNLKVKKSAYRFERFKNRSVDVLMWRRGSLQKHVWHGSMVGLASVGLLTSTMFGGQTLVSATYPGVGGPDPRFVDSFEPFPYGPELENSQETHTDISAKPRAEVIDHEVNEGETISTIARKYGISQETVQWANDITNVNQVKPGQTLKILPVSGVVHTVKSGETLESVAKRYQAESQAIVDFPFNDVPDDFTLRVGQQLVVPDGQPPETKVPAKPKPQPKFLAQGPSSPTFSAPGGGGFVWPTTTSGLSQYYAWYHPGIDLPNRSAPAIVASDGGKVTVAGWPDSYGYGNRVVIDHGNGYKSLYAHLSNIYVTAGQNVSRGQTIGQMGNTGRSTGTHLHFEIHYNGRPVNPLSILK